MADILNRMSARRTVPARAAATAFPALLLSLLAAVAGLVAVPAQAATHARTTTHIRTATSERDPLRVTIDQLTPSTLKANPTKGTVSVSGVVTNDDDQTWQDVNVYGFVGSSPLTTETELTEASLSDPDQSTGYNRITDYGDFSTISSLAPGASATFSLTIPRSDLVNSSNQPITAPGVYWFGIQVLGTNVEGRDGIADGRARTFLPLVGPEAKTQPPVRAAIVVPLRQRVLRQPDGSLAAPSKWLKRISTGGRLDDLLDFATDHPVSWLVDPAVIDAIQQLASGNPPRSLAPTDGSSADSSDAQPSASPTDAKRAATAGAAAWAGAGAASGAAGCACGDGGTSFWGSTSVKTLPSPGVLCTWMEPPNSCARSREIDRPRPVPWPVGLVVKNGWNIFAFTCSGMPVPLSETLIYSLLSNFLVLIFTSGR